MALEPITRQEKIIAGQDLTPITRMEKFLKQFGGSGGGGGLPTGGAPYQYLVTDGSGNTVWEDRLAYESNRLVVDVVKGVQLVKVADEVPSWASMDAPMKVWISDGTNQTVNPENYTDIGNGSFAAGENTIFIATDNVEFNGIVFPEKGVYFFYSSGNTYVTGAASADSDMPEITWDGNVGMLKAIDPKFLPEYVRNNGFLVNVSFDYVDGAGVYTADATYADIEAASNDGINVRAQFEGIFYTLHEVSSGIAKFYYIQASDTSTKSCTIKWLEFSESGVTAHFIVLNVNQ